MDQFVHQEIDHLVSVIEASSFPAELEDLCICELQHRNEKQHIDDQLYSANWFYDTLSHAGACIERSAKSRNGLLSDCEHLQELEISCPDVRQHMEFEQILAEREVLYEVDLHGICDIRDVAITDVIIDRPTKDCYWMEHDRVRKGIAAYGHINFRRRLITSIIQRVAIEQFRQRMWRMWRYSTGNHAIQKLIRSAFYFECNARGTRYIVGRVCLSMERSINQTVPMEMAHHICGYILWEFKHQFVAGRMIYEFLQKTWEMRL